MSRLVRLVVLLVAVCSTQAQVSVPVTVAMMVLTSVPTNQTRLSPNYTDHGTSLSTLQPYWTSAVQLFRDAINEQGGFPVGLSNTTVYFDVDFIPIASATDSDAVKTQRAWEWMNSTSYDVYLPPVSSPDTAWTSPLLPNVCETGRCLYVLPITINPDVYICSAAVPCASKPINERRYDYTLTLAPPSLQIADNWIQTMSIQQPTPQTIVVLYTSEFAVQASSCASLALRRQIVPLLVSYLPTNASIINWTEVVQNLTELAPDLIATFIGYAPEEGRMCARLLGAMKDANYYPYALFLGGSCQVTAPAVDPRWNADGLGDYAYGVTTFDPRETGPTYRIVGPTEVFSATNTQDSPAIFSNVYTKRFPAYSQVVASQAALMMFLLQKMVQQSGVAPNPIAMRNALQFVNSPSHYGLCAVDQYQRLVDRPYPITQLTSTGTSLLIPDGNSQPKYPTPLWSDRVFTYHQYGSSLEWAVNAITIMCLIATFVIIIILWSFRGHPSIKAISPTFCYLYSSGHMMVMGSIFVWSLQETVTTCQTKIWLLLLGYWIQNGSQFVKIYRLMRIFFQEDFKVQKLSNLRLLFVVGIGIGLLSCYTMLWLYTSGVTINTVVVDPLRPIYNVQTCSTPTGWLIGALVITCLPILFNFMVAFRTRNIEPKFNESISMAISIFITGFIVTIVVLLQWSLSSLSALYVVRSFGILLSSVGSMITMFATRFVSIYNHQIYANSSSGPKKSSQLPSCHGRKKSSNPLPLSAAAPTSLQQNLTIRSDK